MERKLLSAHREPSFGERWQYEVAIYTPEQIGQKISSRPIRICPRYRRLRVVRLNKWRL